MRCKIGILLTIIIIFLSNPLLADEDNIITIGGDRNYPPYEYVDDKGDYRGFNVDIMRAVAIEMGIDIRFVPMNWQDALVALENGEIDALQGMSFNEERAMRYEFSDKYLVNSLIYFVRKEDPFIFEINDLKGKRVAIQKNDLSEDVLSKVQGIEIVHFIDLEEALGQLISKEVDVVLGSKLVGSFIIRKNDLTENIKMVGYEFNQTPYSIAFRKGDYRLRNDFNKGLREIKENGTYQKIYEKWFGHEETNDQKALKYILYFFIAAIIVVIGISLIIYRINVKLKREVEKRTKELSFKNIELQEKQEIIADNYRFKKQVLDNLGIGLITIDTTGIITTVNRSCMEMIGLGEAEIGKKYSKKKLEKYFDVEKIEECINHGQKYSYLEKAFVDDNGEFTYSYTLWPLYGDNKNHIGGVLTFRDITDVIMYEKKLNQKDKMESLGRLVLGIAHEIRNPLTAIKTYIELLPIKYDNERFRDKITNQVPKEIDRLNKLLVELLDYSKHKEIEKELVSLKGLISDIKELFTGELDKKGIVLNLDVDEVKLYGDKQQVKQILINLLLNSLESIENQGTINISAKKEGSSIILSIEDDGEGIEEKDLGSIFDPFYTTKSTGTGLGLFMCYKYIKENKGEVKIKSKKNEGTKIDVIFKEGLT